MRRYPLYLVFLLLVGVISGCATMSKKECLNANWRAIGYDDGARGTPYNHLEARRKSCSEYQVVPDDAAYMAGWHEGIKSFCTSERGYQYGVAGQPYTHICPQDVEADFLSGWQQGIRQYCTPDNALRQGLQGRAYRGVCPADLAPAFSRAYQRGLDVRQARIAYNGMSQRLIRERQEMRAQKDPGQRRRAEYEVARLQEETERLYDVMTVREACISPDWFAIGQRDGQTGRSNRATDLAYGCGGSEGMSDVRGYDAGWRQGITDYCTYESGLEVGADNLPYRGVCSGRAHLRFWQGYEEGRDRFRHEGRVPAPRHEGRHVAPAPRPAAVPNRQYQPISELVHKAQPRPKSQPRPKKQAGKAKPDQGKTRGKQAESNTKAGQNHGRQDGKKAQPEENRGKPARPASRGSDH